MPSHRLLVTLLVLIFIIAPFSGPHANIDNSKDDSSSSIIEQVENKVDLEKTDDGSLVAADPISGVLDPVVVEQYGYSGTGLLDASTDSGKNEQSSIPIDNETGWVGSQAGLEIWDMKRLYAENGTLDDGIDGTTIYPDATVGYPYGWDLDWNDPSYGGDQQNVSTTYDKDEGYIVLQTEGQLDTSSGYVEYRHYDDTYIYWNQTIDNVPYSDNLNLSFMYNYDSGIIDDYTVLDGWVWLDVWVDGVNVDYIDLLTECPSRNTWYEFVVANIIDASSTFNLEIGIYIQASSTYYLTNPGGDYDDDGILDFDLTRVNRVLLDNISLLSVDQPSYESVDLIFNVGVYSAAITEFSNYGTAVISNPSYWSDSALSVGISSNVSISCDYDVELLSHNFGDSLWASQPTKTGVAYTINAGESAALTTFTYLGSEGVAIYENFTVEVYLPSDWENVTVFDPFLNDVTGQCIFSPGSLEIPTTILDRLGWWQLTLESPNYAESVSTQIYDTGWSDNSVFRPSNATRVSVSLGTVSETPVIADPVNVTWVDPDDSIWSQDSPSTGIGGVVNTVQRTLGGPNTTAGMWTVTVAWTNGSEVAYGSTSFDMYHTASLAVPIEYTTIQTDVGQIISNFVYYTDADTSDYLLDDSITVSANWTGSTVTFTQDLVKNWWRGEFDTSLVEGGQYTVVVTASRPYFDDVSTQFTVVATQQMTLEILNAGAIPIERGMNEIFTVQLDYELLNGTGITGAAIDVDYSGPGGGLSWYNFFDNNNGHYSVDIICDISATYAITITLNKTYYHGASDSFTLIIGETGTEFELLNGPADVVLFGDSYLLVVEYRNSTGSGLAGANLQVVTITPTVGLTHTGFSHIVDGYYQINLTPTAAGAFSVVISASIMNHETQYATFTLTATGIPTILTSLPSSTNIALDHNFTVQLSLQDESLNPINLANFTVTNPPSGLIISGFISAGPGLYNCTLTPLDTGTFNVLFRSSVDNYQSSSAAFTLIVTEIETKIEFEGDVSSALAEFGDPYILTVYYYRIDVMPLVSVAGANVSVLVQDSGLVITIDEFAGYYLISIRGQATGTWSLTITANKTDHYTATKQFLFEVEEIDTSIEGSSPLEALYAGRSYQFTFSYLFDSNGSYIFDAVVVSSGEGADWVSYTELGNGQYAVNVTPTELGDHYVVLIFEKLGFESASYRLTFTVDSVPISVEILEGNSGLELTTTTLSVSISETDTGNPVSGVSVFYRLIVLSSGFAEDPVPMLESTIPGVYTASITMPDAEEIHVVQVSCEAENYELDEPLSMQLSVTRSFTSVLIVYTVRYWWAIFGVVAVVGALGYRRNARKRRVRQNKITLAIKRRFDDVRSLMGVIVLHKDSGLPVYSKILREGLEETVISAFITAITSFRGEFDIESSSEEWGLIPISDIVRVISTNKLVCAFITTGNPTATQRERMIRFAKTVAFIFDDTMEDVPIVILDHHTTLQFD